MFDVLLCFQIEYEQKKKEQGRKARDDKDKVMDMLFAAFEKHQYYNIKDLEKITRQPVVSTPVLLYTRNQCPIICCLQLIFAQSINTTSIHEHLKIKINHYVVFLTK